MRKLAYISFLFAAGCLPVLLDSPRVLLLILMIAAAAVCMTGFLRKGRRARVAAYCAMGLFCGMMWSSLYRQLYLSPVLALETDDAVMSVTISNYPQKSEYGYSAEGIAVRHGVRFRTAVYLPEDSEAEFWKPGDRVSGTCKLQVRDRKADDVYYLSVGIPMSAVFKEEITHEIASGIPVRFWPAHLSHLLRATAERLYPEDVRGLVVALLTGDKRDISAQQRSDLQISGVYHALAVSGMHVSILMSILSVVTLKSRRLYPMLGIPTLILYCAMIGGAPSVVRAAVMHLFLMAGALLRRESDSPTALGASLLVLAIQNPYCLLNVGLQLSFLATAGILAFRERIFCAIYRRTKYFSQVTRLVCSVAANTLSALSLTVPVMTAVFGVISTYSILTNLLVLQAITAAFFLVFFSCFGAWVSPWLGGIIAVPGTWLLRYTAFCCRMIAKLPFSAIFPDSTYLMLWLTVSYLVMMGFLLCAKKLRPRLAAVAMVGIAFSLCTALWFTRQERLRGEFQFTALDVGQGQCLLLTSGEETAAIDCGGYNAGEQLGRRLLASGDRQLDLLILSHYDPAHTDGLEMLLHLVRVGVIYLPDVPDDSGVWDSVEALAAEHGTEIRYVTSDQMLEFGSGMIQIYAPVSADGGNRSSLPVLASFDTFDILAAGDLESGGETELLRLGQLPDIELLVAGNHGAASSSSSLLLRVLRPEAVVISMGNSDPFAVTRRAEQIGAAVYRTDLLGEITIRR